jgi:hypothetical protein
MNRLEEIKRVLTIASPKVLTQLEDADRRIGCGYMDMQQDVLTYNPRGEFVGSGYCNIATGCIETALLNLEYGSDHKIRGIVIAKGDSQATKNEDSHTLLEVIPQKDPDSAILIDLLYRQKNFDYPMNRHFTTRENLEKAYPKAVVIRELNTGTISRLAENQCEQDNRLTITLFNAIVQTIIATKNSI